MVEIISSLGIVFSPESLFALVVGVFFGAIVGAIPGLGTMVAITVCIPFTLQMGSGAAISLLLGVYIASIYGGSITAVLINTPGTPQSACTGFDGYSMAKSGKADEALGWVTVASVFGGLLSCVILILAAPQLASISVKYGGPLEICGFIVLGLTCVTSLSEGNQIKGILMALAGLFVAIIGMDPNTGVLRFTFGTNLLMGGIDIMVICVAMYPLAELFYRQYEIKSECDPKPVDCKTIKFPSFRDMLKRMSNFIRSSFVGVGMGILPGTGATAATFISYTVAKRVCKTGLRFGKGEPDGIVAAEASNNAVSGGALVPTLALGIPGEATMALMLATLTLHGITPGIRLMSDNPDVVHATFLALILANIVLIPCAIIVVRMFGHLIKIPPALLLGAIAVSSIIGVYLPRGTMADVWLTLLVGALTFIIRFLDFPVAPFIIGYVLSAQLEYRISQVVTFMGDMTVIEIFTSSPLAMVLFSLALVFLLSPLFRKYVLKKEPTHMNECRE